MTRLALLALAAAAAWATGPAGASAGEGPLALAYSSAQTHDADFRAARFELQSREQLQPIARAALLPSVAATYSESRVRGERESTNALGQAFTQTLGYSNPVAALQLRTPLFNADAYQRYRSAESQVDSARSVFEARAKELLDRLGTAYVQRLVAEEAVALAQSQVDALKAQADSARRRYAAGEGTRTDVADTDAALMLARVQWVEASDQRETAARALERIVGSTPPLRGLPEDLAVLPLPLATLPEWLAEARANSPALAARQHQLAAARSEVQRSRAGHLPRLDLVASAIDARNETVSTLNQKTRQYSAGLQLTVPLYAGGGTEAVVVQAQAEVAKSEAQLESEREQLAIDVRTQFQLVNSGAQKVAALGEGLLASALGLEGAGRGQAAGLRTAAEVLDATRRVFQARRDLVRARYETLLARLRLQALAGRPTAAIVADIDRHLSGPAPSAASPMERSR